MKYKLEKNNKYKGNVNLEKLRGKIVGTIKNKINFYSVILTMEMALLVSLGAKSLYLGTRATNVMYSEMNYDVDKARVGVIEMPSVYSELEQKYNNMSNDEKSAFVADVFSRVINSSDEYTEEEKKQIINREGVLLEQYGYNYYFRNIFDFLVLLDSIEIRRNVKLDTAAGLYYSNSNLIELEEDSSIAHETEHAITGNGISALYAHFILEAMNSSTDRHYYGKNSYIKEMRMQMLFLSKIIGKDNLLKCYFNGDFDLLKNLLGKRANSLLGLFSKEYDCFKAHFKIDDKLVKMTVDEMMDIYKENNKEIDPDVEFIYQCCLPNSPYNCDETIFSNTLNYKVRSIFNFIDGTFLNKNILMKYDLDTNKSLVMHDCFNSSNNKGFRYEKLNFLFNKNIVKDITLADSSVNYLENYLKKVGVSDVDFWVYNILNNDCPIAVSIEGFDYDKKNFKVDFKKIYQDKYNYMIGNNKLIDIYMDMRVFGNSRDEYFRIDKFRYLTKSILKDVDIDIFKIINNYYDSSIDYKCKLFKREYFKKGNINSNIFRKIIFLFGYDEALKICKSDDINMALRDRLKTYSCSDLDLKIALYDILSLGKMRNLNRNSVLCRLVEEKCNNSNDFLALYCDMDKIGIEDNEFVKKVMEDCGINIDDYKGLSWDDRGYEHDDNSVMVYNRLITLDSFNKEDDVIRIKVPNIFSDYIFEVMKNTNKKALISSKGIIEHDNVREYLFDVKDLENCKYITCGANVEKKSNMELGFVNDNSRKR